MKIKFVHEDNIKGLELPGRVSKILIGPETVNSNNLSFGITIAPPKTAMRPPHTHYKEDEVIYVIEGKGEIISGSEKEKIFPGIAIYIPAGVEHRIINKSEVSMKLACSFHPPVDLSKIPSEWFSYKSI